jgi:excisionase family DNA binding protein
MNDLKKPNSTHRLLLTQDECCEICGVSSVTWWKWVREGRIDRVRLGHRTVRYKRADLEAMIDNFTVGIA